MQVDGGRFEHINELRQWVEIFHKEIDAWAAFWTDEIAQYRE
jgi:hypothetical protein